MQKGLVSIITPCYNTGSIIHRLLDSVLTQSYPSIAMLVVDDGSTDNSKEVICSYIPRFEERGYSLEYHYQQNSGQSVAINNALKWVDGEYMVWPDSDDWYTSPEAISRMVEECSKSNRVGLVRCLNRQYDPDMNLLGEIKISPELLEKEQFDNCVLHKGDFYYVPGDYMVRMDVLDETIPGREIYTEKMAGQNGQLMFPVLYGRECITIPEYMYGVLVRPDSHCHGQDTYEKSAAVINGYINLIFATLDKIIGLPSADLKKYKDGVLKRYLPELFDLAVAAGEKQDAVALRQRLEELDAFHINVVWTIRYHLCQYGWFQKVIKSFGKLGRAISN